MYIAHVGWILIEDPRVLVNAGLRRLELSRPCSSALRGYVQFIGAT